MSSAQTDRFVHDRLPPAGQQPELRYALPELMALQMHGGLGVKVGTKVESLYRDIRSLRIYEGATEVQQLIIGKSVLKG